MSPLTDEAAQPLHPPVSNLGVRRHPAPVTPWMTGGPTRLHTCRLLDTDTTERDLCACFASEQGEDDAAVTRDTMSCPPACQAHTETRDANITDDSRIPAIWTTHLHLHTWSRGRVVTASELLASWSKHASHTQPGMTDTPTPSLNTTATSFSTTCFARCRLSKQGARMNYFSQGTSASLSITEWWVADVRQRLEAAHTFTKAWYEIRYSKNSGSFQTLTEVQAYIHRTQRCTACAE